MDWVDVPEVVEEVMKNSGSGIWWFVGIGLALAWAFSASAGSEEQNSTQLGNNPDGFQLLNNSQTQVRAPQIQASPLPLHLQQPLQASPARRVNEPVRDYEPDFHVTESPIEAEEVLPFVDLSDSPQDSFVSTEPAESNMLPELPAMDQPIDDMFSDSEFENLESDMAAIDFANIPQPADNQLADTGAVTADEFPADSGGKVVANPFFSSSDSQPSDSLENRIGSPKQITNPFVNDPVETDLFVEESTAPAQKVPTLASQPARTEFASFDDLKNEQDQWANEIGSTGGAGSYASSDIAPMIPLNQHLTLDPGTIQRCVNHIEQGKSLARRRAAFAAREEFYSALKVIAQSNDAQTRSKTFTTSLSKAVVALEEANDFYIEQAHTGIDVDVLMVIDGHESKIIPKQHAQNMSSLSAIQAYFDYARQNLHDAVGQGPVGSEALYSLGKLFTLSATHQLSGNPFDYAKSTVMHYAALDCDPKNYRSSNELGVLMARNGRLEKARDLFRDSLIVKQVPETWKNLSMVHEKLAHSSNGGVAQENAQLAQMANDEYSLALQQAPSANRVQWVAPNAYNPQNNAVFSEARVAELPGLEIPEKKSFIKKLFR